MKSLKVTCFSLFIVLLMGITTNSYAWYNPVPFVLNPDWYEIKHWAEYDPEFYGTPLFIEEIQYTGKMYADNNGKYRYAYRVIIRRPSEDNGSGIVYFGTTPFRILYWAGEASVLESNFIAAIYGYETYQDWTPDKPRQVILYFNEPFLPGRYFLKIAPFPYPSAHGTTLSKYIDYSRSNGASYLSGMFDYLRDGISLGRNLQNMAYGKVLDVGIDTFMVWGAAKYGVFFVLDIPAIMPDIHSMKIRDANQELSQSGLIPAPGTCVPTPYQEAHERVFKEQFLPGYSLAANTRVAYKYYCYDPSTPRDPQPSPSRPITSSSKNKPYIEIRIPPRFINMCEDSTVSVRIDNFNYGVISTGMSIDLSGLNTDINHAMYITGMPSGSNCKYYKSSEIETRIQISGKGHITVHDEKGRIVIVTPNTGTTYIPGNQTKRFKLKIHNTK